MRLLSAYDDFSERTLAKVPGVLGKLEFLSGIHSSIRGYHHWGLENTHGGECAQEAMGEAHTVSFLAELSTPLSDLFTELVSEAEQEGIGILQRVQSILALNGLVPEELDGGSRAHHHYVLMSLLLVARARALTTHQGASPLPPPAR